MKPAEYHSNRISEIMNKGSLIRFQIPVAAEYGEREIDRLKVQVIDFLALTPDENNVHTDVAFVVTWKSVYEKLSRAIREIKDTNDYRLDQRRRELGAIATVMKATRFGVYWVD